MKKAIPTLILGTVMTIGAQAAPKDFNYNVERFADYMRSSDFNTQFICVTHRRGTMEAADMLYGVTMQEKGITKLLELNISELEKQLNLENGR